MADWKVIAQVLAKESAYRISKRRGKRKLLTYFYGSMVKSNLLGIALFSVISLITVLPIYFISGEELPLIVSSVLGFLGIMELLMGAFTLAMSLHVIQEDRLLEPLRHLPLDRPTVRKAVLGALLYMGSFSYPFLVITPSLVLGVRFGPLITLWGVLEAITLMILSAGLALIAGSLYTRYSRSLVRRLASLTAWIALFSFGLLYQFLPKWGERPLNVPPFSYGLAGLGDLSASITSLITLALALLTFKYGSDRFWRAATVVEEYEAPEEMGEWTVTRYPSFYPVVKDLKLLLRNTKLLASVIYYLAFFPLFVLLPSILSEETPVGALLPQAIIAGGIGGLSVIYAYAAEGNGARLLYHLPVSRGWVMRGKFLTMATLTFPLVLAVVLALTLTSGLLGFISGLSYTLSLYSGIMLNSKLVMWRIPKEPAAWTEGMAQARSGTVLLVFLGEFILYGFLALLPLIPSLLRGGFAALVEPNQVYPESLVLALLTPGIALLLTYLASRDERPLGGI